MENDETPVKGQAPVEAETIEARIRHFTEACRRRGLRLTPQRLDVFRVLASTREHPSVEAIYAGVRARLPTVSRDTVYRTVSTLREHGLIDRVEVLDDRARYDANLERHHHLVCVRCQRVEDVMWPELDGMPLPTGAGSWGAIDRVHAEVRGVCNACRGEGEKT